jgi:hypothetical protein
MTDPTSVVSNRQQPDGSDPRWGDLLFSPTTPWGTPNPGVGPQNTQQPPPPVGPGTGVGMQPGGAGPRTMGNVRLN